jgi:glucokinase
VDDRRAGWTIGIDVGGTKIAAGLLDPASGRRGNVRVRPTAAERGGEAVLAEVEAIAHDMAAEAAASGERVIAVGVGVPELVDAAGRITSAHAFDWRALPVLERLGDLGPTVIAADVRAAALAEARLGAGIPFGSFAYVSVGTGISSTLVIDGVPWAGSRGAALVLSSGPLSVPCPCCGALEPVVLEEFASGPALVRRLSEHTGRAWPGAEAVLAAADSGDAAALDVVASAATALGSAIGFLVNVTDPEAVVVGGGLGSAPGPYWDCLVPSVRRHVWNPAAQSLPVVQSSLGPNAGWLGAALAAIDAAGKAGRAAGAAPTLAVVGGR